jgi:hypothetical protein
MMLYMEVREEKGDLVVRAPMNDEEIGVYARFLRVVKPGEKCLTLTYDELKAMGSGKHEINFAKGKEK